jgi:hypothetical protein
MMSSLAPGLGRPATHVNVRADHALDAVVLEVRDDSGAGFRTYFGAVQATGIAWRLATAVDRLRLPRSRTRP